MKNTHGPIIKNITLLFGLLTIPFASIIAQSSNENYVKTKTYKVATSGSTNNSNSITTNVTYLDGLGRPIQQVAHKQSGTGGDLITHIEYDGLGRQGKEYLPYERSSSSLSFEGNAVTEVESFYNSFPFGYTTNPYTEKEFEDSPLNRVLKQAAPGNDWKMGSDHEVKYKYDTNNSNQVYHFKISSTSGTFPTLSYHGKYAAKQLYKTSTYDENNENSSLKGSVVEYKDKLGRVVLKRHYTSSTGRTSATDTNPAVAFDTYYVYDDHGNLSIVLPPKLSEQIIVGSSLASNKQALLDGLGYQYSYDHRNRLIRKQLPGKQAEFISYDSLDRPISIGPTLSPFGDSTLGSTRTKYDVFGRVAYTLWVPGWFGENTRQSIEASSSNTTQLSETRTANATTVNGVQFNYTNDVAPTGGYHVLTINYYDDYDWDGAPSIPSTVGNGDSYVHYKNNNNDKPKGLPTGTWVRILESETDTNAKVTYTLYDNKARAVRIHTAYPQGGHTQVDSKYDFIGKVEYTRTKHKKSNGDPEQTVFDYYTYDSQQRLEKHTHKVNSQPTRLLAKNSYDALGQLIEKKTGGTDVSAGTYFQKVDYKYNVRGWLTDINNINSLSGNPVDLFAFKINYNKTISNDVNGQVEKLYNGNIAETSWRTSSDNVLRRYGYSYDYLNRLLDAWYQKPGNSTPVPQSYDEHLTYDSNGNILTLQRNGQYEFNSPIPIDDLDYDYYDYTNKLKNVYDNEQNEEGFDDTKSNSGTTSEYVYDDFGNLIEDDNKEITNIVYNHLNLPTEVTFDNTASIAYLYCADGVKLKKEILAGGAAELTVEYYDGFQYTDGDLDFFPTAEGTVDVTHNGLGGVEYHYTYHYLDHLGNIRLRYAKDPDDGVVKILEESHYYPFGLKQEGYNQTRMEFGKVDNTIVLTEVDPFLGTSYKYGFGGKELEDKAGSNWHDFGARNYDAALGRWMNVDPITHHSMSPYNAFDNNPVFWADPSGADAVSVQGGMKYTGEDAINVFNSIKNSIGESNAEDDGPPDFKDFFKRALVQGRNGDFSTTPLFNSSDNENTSNNPYDRDHNYYYEDRNETMTQLSGIGKFSSLLSLNLVYMDELYSGGKALSKIDLEFPNQLKWFGRAAAGASVGFEYYKYKTGRISKSEFSYKSTWTGLGVFGGSLGLGLSSLEYLMGTVLGGHQRAADNFNKWNTYTPTEKRSAIRKSLSNKHGMYKDSNPTCFIKGTKILMKNYKTKLIENVKIGDTILSVNMKTFSIENDIVKNVTSYQKKKIIKLKLSNNIKISFTEDHPFWIVGKGWCVFNVKKSYQNGIKMKLKKIEKGDFVLLNVDGELKKSEVKLVYDTGQFEDVYNIDYVRKNNTFFANKVLVHNRKED